MPDSFEYIKPSNINQLIELKSQGAILLAGGTDVLVNMREEKLNAKIIVDLKDVKELQGIRNADEGIFIGAAETVQNVVEHTMVSPYAALCEGAGSIGCRGIRNRATIGGNICNGSPSADSVPGLLVNDAKVSLLSLSGRRVLPLTDFLLAPGKVDLAQDEILEGILLPIPARNSKSKFYRCTRVKGMDLSGISIAVYCEITNGEIGNIKIAFGALYKTVQRAWSAENILNSGKATKALIEQAARAVLAEVNPRKTSLRASPEYKKAMVPVLIEKALCEMKGCDIL